VDTPKLWTPDLSKQGGVFFGGTAAQVESSLGLSGDQILYVGDHLFGDVRISKAYLRWRTALMLRELESEVSALIDFLPDRRRLEELMQTKFELEAEVGMLRVAIQRSREGHADPPVSVDNADRDLEQVRRKLATLDEAIAPWRELPVGSAMTPGAQ
jgi:5'-nucleotidase